MVRARVRVRVKVRGLGLGYYFFFGLDVFSLFFFSLVHRRVIGTQKSHFDNTMLWGLPAQSMGKTTVRFQIILVILSIMHESLLQLSSWWSLHENNRAVRLSLWRFGWRSSTKNEHYGIVIHCTSNRCDYCWIKHGIQVCPDITWEREGGGRWSWLLVWTWFFPLFVFILDRKKNIDIWKRKFFWSRQGSASLSATHQPGFLPHHGPNSGVAKTNKASEREMNCLSSSSPFVLPHYTHE